MIKYGPVQRNHIIYRNEDVRCAADRPTGLAAS